MRPRRAGAVTERERTKAVPVHQPASLLPWREGNCASPLLLLTSRLQ